MIFLLSNPNPNIELTQHILCTPYSVLLVIIPGIVGNSMSYLTLSLLVILLLIHDSLRVPSINN